MFESVNMPASEGIDPGEDRLGLAEFHNALRILLNLDFRDLVEAGILQPHDDANWERFQRDPFRYFIRAGDVTAERLWGLIESGQPCRRTGCLAVRKSRSKRGDSAQVRDSIGHDGES